jgi:hypothetical protein
LFLGFVGDEGFDSVLILYMSFWVDDYAMKMMSSDFFVLYLIFVKRKEKFVSAADEFPLGNCAINTLFVLCQT